ncbi:SDR family NAD(P)-dependent oxidoreductase [Marinobacter litoralis]|uniref:SDR family NAD(P)-dependent oxidoreductase n=1 Tax=Marinobacter litoralis TaxID=187981 RepID=UPI0018EBC178|nr:SDR family NAD(P)-dependent oxidoreductase [Marinobacter litoralis]MBJ6135962.1 SDR family NAD(P)-dependent oxidoreductase [Marinobacter litoralis]
MTVIIAGVSGAIGGALAERYLAEQPSEPLIGLARKVENVSGRVREHPAVHLVEWQAEHPLDLVSHPEVRSLLASAQGDLSLIYAAGWLHDDTASPEKRVEDIQPDTMLQAYQVNCVGFALLVQALSPWFKGKRLSRVAAVSAKVGSIQDNRLGGWYAYRCSKAALNMLAKNLSVELPRKYAPVACVALHPGTTHSALSEPFSQSLAKLTVHEPGATADNLFNVLANLTEEDNGRFINWDGRDLPW